VRLWGNTRDECRLRSASRSGAFAGEGKRAHAHVSRRDRGALGGSLRMRAMWRYTRRMSREFRLDRPPVDVLNYEIAQEQAVALGRIGRALEQALARLREFDAAHPRSGAPTPAQQARRALVTEAGHALWMFVVQREACGLRDSRTVMRDYRVPGEVQQCMGAALATSTRGRNMAC
jgi:Family of unknown function (DUF6665)